MKDADGFDSTIRFLERLELDLGNGDRFFELNAERYRQVCMRAAFQALLANRPDELDDATWRENASEFVELIMAIPFPDRLDISFVDRTTLDRIAARNRGQNLANYTPITYLDVLEWVRADPADGGKDKTLFEESKRMMERDDDQITHEVFRAITQHQLGIATKDFSRITQRLEDWVNSRVLKGDLDSLLRLVLEAWQTVLTPILERDLTEWVDDVLGTR